VFIAIAIVVVVALAALTMLATARRRASTGRLSRETRRADASEPAPGAEPAPVPVAPGGEVVAPDEDARARAAEARRSAEGGLPVKAGGRGVVRYEPVDEEELGVTRRQFFNRGILTGLALGVGGFGAASLAFLWPVGSGGSTGQVTVGTTEAIDKAIADKTPFYNAGAKTYIQPYPKADIPKAEKVYDPRIVAGMKQGYVALYQKCVHLGCRVPWCQTSQWFECPCHGSKYNRVGEKRGGPAPRGLDRFVLKVSGGSVIVDTNLSTGLVQGPPIGTDTTGQGQEGAPCV
jgi:cytochrome b6-f complex iron-sulfur subunit